MPFPIHDFYLAIVSAARQLPIMAAKMIVPLAHVDLYSAVMPQAFVRRLAGRNRQLNDDLPEVARDIRRLTSSRAS